MQHIQLKLGTLILFLVGVMELQAQEAIPASGGSGGSASYSIGQTVYTTITGNNGTVVQGVQQPYEISVVNGLEELNINLNVSTYPNPTNDFLILKIENYDKENLSYQLFDINGKLFENKKITNTETSITMNNLIPSTYYLKVIEGNKKLKTFKIIKY